MTMEKERTDLSVSSDNLERTKRFFLNVQNDKKNIIYWLQKE